MSAKRYWNADLFESPQAGVGPEKVHRLLESIVAASAMEKRRLWRYRLRPGHIELLADFGAAAATFIDDRELMICCGGVLYQMKLALKRLGCLGEVESFPEMGDAGQVARIHFNCSSAMDSQNMASLQDVVCVENSHHPIGKKELPETILDAFRSAAASEKAWLEFARCESTRKHLLALAQGERQMAAALATVTRSETQFGIRAGMRSEGAQFSNSEVGNWNPKSAWWKMPFLKFGGRTVVPTGSEFEAGFNPGSRTAELAVLKTKTDDNYGWLATGLALARMQLQACASGLQLHCFDESFRKRFLREQLRTAVGRKGFAQSIIGFQAPPAQIIFSMTQQGQHASASSRASL